MKKLVLMLALGCAFATFAKVNITDAKAEQSFTTMKVNNSMNNVKDTIVPVTGVSLDVTEKILNLIEYQLIEKSFTLTATVEPEDATDKSVVWSSDNEDVATVVDGVVTAVGTGSATITVTAGDGNFEASCSVTVLLIPEEQGWFELDPDTGYVTVYPAECVTEIEVYGGENLEQIIIPISVEKIIGVENYQVHITYCSDEEITYDITGAFIFYGDAIEGVTYEIEPDGSVWIDDICVPCTPNIDTVEFNNDVFVFNTLAIPGLTYTLKRGTEIGDYPDEVASVVAQSKQIELKDETTSRPSDKAFYVISVSIGERY